MNNSASPFRFSWLAAFCAMFLADFAWALYVSAVKANEALSASMWAVALFLLGAFAVVSYVGNRWLLIPASLGAFCGTWFAVSWMT